MNLLIVSDGPRDEAAVPPLVENVLGRTIEHEFEPWKRLHGRGNRGYGRKLRYAIRQARDRAKDGLVATVDSDNRRGHVRLQKFEEARDEDRQSAPKFPTAVGEAVPELEAWLLDDPVAVRQVLRLDSSHDVPTPKKSRDPKATLNELMSACSREERRIELLAEMAREMVASRCKHRSTTGFAKFVDDVVNELR